MNLKLIIRGVLRGSEKDEQRLRFKIGVINLNFYIMAIIIPLINFMHKKNGSSRIKAGFLFRFFIKFSVF